MIINKQWLGRMFRDEGEGDGGGGSGDNGGAGDSPFVGLGEDSRAYLEKAGIKDLEGLVSNHRDQASHIGNSIRVPSAEAGEQDIKAFHDKLMKHAPNLMYKPSDTDDKMAIFDQLGRPAEIAGYEGVEVPEIMGESFNDDRLNAFREVAHKHGLTKDQFQGVMNDILQLDAQGFEAAVAKTNESKEALQREWGEAYEPRTKETLALLEQTGAPADVMEAAKNGQIGGETLKWLHNLYTRLGGEHVDIAHDQGHSGRITPSEAQAQMDEIMNNPSHAYWNSSHPNHENAVRKVIELGRKADPKNANVKITGQGHGAGATELKI